MLNMTTMFILISAHVQHMKVLACYNIIFILPLYVHVVDSVALKSKVLASKMRKQLRLATWNVSGLCSERKQKEIADLLACNSIDIVAVQESWEKEDSKIDISGLVSLVLVKGVREGREGLAS